MMETKMEDSISSSSALVQESVTPSMTDSTPTGSERIEKKPTAFVGQESRVINRIRLVVFGLLILSATVVSVTVYLISHNGEESDFESHYNRVAEEISSAFDGVIGDHSVAFGALRVAYTAQGRDGNDSWPFVSLTSFQQRAATARRLSRALHLSFFPIVDARDRGDWERYVAQMGLSWIDEAMQYEIDSEFTTMSYDPNSPLLSPSTAFYPIQEAYQVNGQVMTKNTTSRGPYAPLWQSSPLLLWAVNVDYFANPYFKEFPKVHENGKAVLSRFIVDPPGNITTSLMAQFLSLKAGEPVHYYGDPMSHFYYPVFKSFNKTDKDTMAILTTLFHWQSTFEDILPEEEKGIIVVLEDPCNGAFTYEINGPSVRYVGPSDMHDEKLEKFERRVSFEALQRLDDGTEFGMPFDGDYCPKSIRIYPSATFVSDNESSTPIIMTCAVLLVFVFTTGMFLWFNRLVERRQTIVLKKAVNSSAIVSSLFPQSVADRLMEQANIKGNENGGFESTNKRLKSFLSGDVNNNASKLQPIADLFPFATVLFADIAGFTAWSSAREPSHVFLLLQTMYLAFDEVAKRRKVFKVETIGDSYVAVTGVPDKQDKHALIMARFAVECLDKIRQVTTDLGVTLGPGTEELQMRFGIHSGPVTAGVLLGERARFQLFGDTVNTAARMENTGIPGKIQISSATASLLVKDGKESWVTPREDLVNVKGKGIIKTCWLTINERKRSPSVVSGSSRDFNSADAPSCGIPKTDMFPHVNWICELFQAQIKAISQRKGGSVKSQQTLASPGKFTLAEGNIPMDEVVETLIVPEYTVVQKETASESVELCASVKEQLFDCISAVANTYRDNPFHNFEHACHVTLSVNKLLQRIVTPDVDVDGDIGSHLYEYTHGINSDPITILAILFAAVIHDADHQGVSNVQLMKEQEHLAIMYRRKSVAEQNSVDVVWNLLMSECFADLRQCMFPTESDLKRFRQVLVNTVLATDIFDKELNDLRKSRWEKAFSNDQDTDNLERQRLRATIVIEHLMQASDVSHTMQHWHVYRKWNQKLFEEMFLAYQCGRMEANPCDFWYKGELGFFDNYIIPLAKKLKECRVFGVSSDEYLNYAEQNRTEWEARGQQIVTEMVSVLCGNDLEEPYL